MAKTGYVERLATIRQAIVEVKAEARRVAAARIPLDEACDRIAPLVDQVALRWTPMVASLAAPAMPTPDVIVQAATADPWVLSGLIAVVARDGLEAALRGALEMTYGGVNPADCISLAERPGRLEALATKLHELAALRRMFTLAVRAELLPHRPHIAMLDESGNVREGFLEPADFEAVCTATNKHGQTILPPDVQDALRFAYLTGWRRGAVRSLEWRDVDLRARTLRLRAANAKNKRGKVLPLRADLLALLERRAEVRRPDCPYVFHRDGKPLVDFRKAWKAACKAAGFSGLVPHDLRRSAARNAVRSGVPEQVAMELGGWRTRSVFARYNVTSEADLAAAVERISGYVAERATEARKVRPLRTEPAQNPHNPAADDTPARRAGGLSS
jgi:integrase